MYEKGPTFHKVSNLLFLLGASNWQAEIGLLRRVSLPLYFSGTLLSSPSRFVDTFLSALGYGFATMFRRSTGRFAGLFDVLTSFLRVVLSAVFLRQCGPNAYNTHRN